MKLANNIVIKRSFEYFTKQIKEIDFELCDPANANNSFKHAYAYGRLKQLCQFVLSQCIEPEKETSKIDNNGTN